MSTPELADAINKKIDKLTEAETKKRLKKIATLLPVCWDNPFELKMAILKIITA